MCGEALIMAMDELSQEKIERLEIENANLRALLRALEWNENGQCRICYHFKCCNNNTCEY